MVAAKYPEQTNIPGTEPPSIPEVEQAFRQWQNAKSDQKDAAESAKLKHSLLLARMVEHKLERYPYIDEQTGKRRLIVVKREPKIATAAAPKPSKPKKTKRGGDSKPDDTGLDSEATPPAAKEHSDPFGSARRAVADRDAEVAP